MRVAIQITCLLLFGFFFEIGIVGETAALAGDADKIKPLTGGELFVRRWELKDPLCPNGDGLGPCFNSRSCVACHNQGGMGGGGDNEHNVDLLTLQSSPADVRRIVTAPNQAPLRMHPNFFAKNGTIVLHRFGVDTDYEGFRFGMLGIAYSPEMRPAKQAQFWANVAKNERRAAPVEDFTVQGIRFRLTHRNTPALFGAGLIDAIPALKIEQMEQQQTEAGGDITGRMAPAKPSHHDPFADPKILDALEPDTVGRFGWRGQTATLADFVLGACANELGLQTPRHEQALNPLDPKIERHGVDLEAEECRMLIQFVSQLPRPVQIKPRQESAIREIDRGEALFRMIGCAACHVENFGGVDGLYSDLLLHDLGKELADPVPAMPKTVVVGERPQFGYFGGIVDVLAEVPTETRQEWRTPPLWGIADSAPYLHDGRANNLHQAITMHGGEASVSKEKYDLLVGGDRDAVARFLMTLRAPGKLKQ